MRPVLREALENFCHPLLYFVRPRVTVHSGWLSCHSFLRIGPRMEASL